jgi:outer membrane protein TolC
MPRPSVLRTVSALAVAACLAGCKTVGPDFDRPVATTTTNYLPAGEAAGPTVRLGEAVAADWWRYLGSPELDEVMRLAVAGNPSLQAADASLAAAQAQIAAARAQALPQVNANAGVTGERLNLAAFGFDTSRFEGIDPNPTLSIYQGRASATASTCGG